MTFEEWYDEHVKYMNLADFKPWLGEAWDAAVKTALINAAAIVLMSPSRDIAVDALERLAKDMK